MELNQTYNMRYNLTELLLPGLAELQALNISKWM